ncbi:MAG TPA: hypothetical protein VHG28_08870 [Longimicrobiaceae bacterium]|nr:hypothetical protein [Longimicrobiaceae bacterium]
MRHGNTLKIFADYLRDSYAARVSTPVGFEEERFRPLRRPILLNCLDWVYGHALLKLLNAQYYLDRPEEFDLVLLVPRFLRWMVPEGAATVWTVDLPLSRGAEWNDWIASEIRRRLEPLGECHLSFAFSHPHPEDFRIERFTRVAPFPLGAWAERASCPTVTYIWREDRGWGPAPGRSLAARAGRGLRRLAGLPPVVNRTLDQVVAMAEHLRALLPSLDFAVAGMGRGRALPEWILDLRSARADEAIERAWCERYARSHVVIGVHGSHMLLPTGHAGAMIQMVPENAWDNRWGNLIQDVLVRGDDVREALFRYQFLPTDTMPEKVATIAASLIRFQPTVSLHFGREFTDHVALTRSWSRLPGEFAAVSG